MKTYPFNSGTYAVAQLADELVDAGVPMGGEAHIARNAYPMATEIEIVANDDAEDATVAAVVAAHDPVPVGPSGPEGPAGPQGAQGPAGPAGPAPAGTGFVRVTGGVLDTPSPNANVGAGTGSSLAVTGAVTSSGTAGIGYAAGAGGTVTQATSKSAGVTLNKICGRITMHGAALAAGAEVSFVVTNSTVAATDVVVACVQSVGNAGAYFVTVGAVSNGSFALTVGNASTGSLSQAVVLNFLVLKGAIA